MELLPSVLPLRRSFLPRKKSCCHLRCLCSKNAEMVRRPDHYITRAPGEDPVLLNMAAVRSGSRNADQRSSIAIAVSKRGYMSKKSANWAVLVYISADRILTNFAVDSLKQLKFHAGPDTIVLAQVHLGNEPETRRYVFDGSSDAGSSIKVGLQKDSKPRPTPVGIGDPENLTKFLEWAARFDARHRCLFLWGHGYELLLNEDDRSGGRNYLSPKGLQEALKSAKQKLPALNLDIIGIDACAMSLYELASELRDCGDFLVASQEDVPDQSFPYDRILEKLSGPSSDDTQAISASLPGLYREVYQDYVVGEGMGTSEITLTSIRLKNAGKLKESLTQLSKALLGAVGDSHFDEQLLLARKESRAFATGLFVDLGDFCAQLGDKPTNSEVKSACAAVLSAIDSRSKDAVILAKQPDDNQSTRCHGISIYFPYLAKRERDELQNSVSTGGTDLLSHLPLLLKGGNNHPLKARSVKVREIEKDFESLAEVRETGWHEFIQQGWSVILASKEANELDKHYSAEQCAVNLLSLRKPAAKQAAAGSRA